MSHFGLFIVMFNCLTVKMGGHLSFAFASEFGIGMMLLSLERNLGREDSIVAIVEIGCEHGRYTKLARGQLSRCHRDNTINQYFS